METERPIPEGVREHGGPGKVRRRSGMGKRRCERLSNRSLRRESVFYFDPRHIRWYTEYQKAARNGLQPFDSLPYKAAALYVNEYGLYGESPFADEASHL